MNVFFSHYFLKNDSSLFKTLKQTPFLRDGTHPLWVAHEDFHHLIPGIPATLGGDHILQPY